jgi:catechol 2,3-dioxygenase-like lactoylglutathione lyase family enzyme
MTPSAILESVIYAADLEEAERFYRRVFGLEPFQRVEGRHLFYRLGDQVMLIFNPEATMLAAKPGRPPVPPHGARGQGHICFKATAAEIPQWREKLAALGILIEADFEWPNGGRSLYLRDPAGNSIELAEPRIWGIPA